MLLEDSANNCEIKTVELKLGADFYGFIFPRGQIPRLF